MIMSAMNRDKTGPFAQKSILIKLLADEVIFEIINMIYYIIIEIRKEICICLIKDLLV